MQLDFDVLFSAQGVLYLIMLSLLEIVLGIDNIIFISIITDKLPLTEQRKARNIGLILALLIRLFLLTIVGYIMGMTETFDLFGIEMSGQKLVLLGGGLFLIYKSTVEMHKNIVGQEESHTTKKGGLAMVILQIVLIDIVFSFDSIITAIGMTNGIAKETGGNPIIIIYMAVIVSMVIMMLFAKPISDFINKRPTIKMLALAFLVTIGAILVAEAFGQEIPKGYIYFAMVYAMSVEFLNIRMRKKAGKEE
ncbi:MAG: TerC family protein [Crocinitomicaceae bacterium]|jgi:predicted tellurium resistance membrane protein TerC|nr:TerC family protein [Crocinitomicaceae bacterium]